MSAEPSSSSSSASSASGAGAAPRRGAGGSSPWVVIVGAGFGGLTVATALDRHLDRHPDSMRVVLVESNHEMAVQVAQQFVLSKRTRTEHVTQSYTDHKLQNVFFVQDEVLSVDASRRLVFARGHKFRYSYLVLASGTVADTQAVPGLARAAYSLGSMRAVTQLRDALGDWRSGTLAVVGAEAGELWPYGYALLLAGAAARKRRKHPDVPGKARVVLTTPDERAPAGELGRLLEERGVEVRYGRRPVYADAGARAVIFHNGERLSYELLAATLPRRRADYLATVTGLGGGAATGPVECDRRTGMTSLPGVYAVGDSSAASPSGVAAALRGQAVAADLVRRVGAGGRAAPWDAAAAAAALPAEKPYHVFLETGGGEAMRLTYDPASGAGAGARPTADGPGKAHYKSLVEWWEALVTDWFQLADE